MGRRYGVKTASAGAMRAMTRPHVEDTHIVLSVIAVLNVAVVNATRAMTRPHVEDTHIVLSVIAVLNVAVVNATRRRTKHTPRTITMLSLTMLVKIKTK